MLVAQSLLLRRLTSQVVSTPSKDLSLAWLALTVPYLLSRIQPVLYNIFQYCGDSPFSFPRRLPIPPIPHGTNSNYLLHGGPDRTRTCNQRIMSPLRCQLRHKPLQSCDRASYRKLWLRTFGCTKTALPRGFLN